MKRSEMLKHLEEFLKGTREVIQKSSEEYIDSDEFIGRESRFLLNYLEKEGFLGLSVYCKSSGNYISMKEYNEELYERDEPYELKWESEDEETA